jgi:glycosyltransferase involved in cell wall biosynthesis
MRKVKVLLFTDRFSQYTGGNKRTIEVMKRAEAHGIDYVSVVDVRNMKDLARFQSSGIELPRFLYSINFGRRKGMAGLFYPLIATKSEERLAKLAREEKVDLIFSPHEFAGVELVARTTSFFARLPWTVLLQLVPVVGDLRPPKSLLELGKLRLYLSMARDTTLLSVSPTISSYLINLDSALRIEYLNPSNGVDLARINSLSPMDDHYDAVYSAHLIREKGAEEILPIWRKIVDIRSGAKLAVSGWGTREEELKFKKQILQLGLQHNVMYFGFLGEDSLTRLVKSCDLMIHPSHRDSFALTVMEALACGTPVVTYSIAAIKTIYSECRAVFQVREGDLESMAKAVLNLLDHQGSRGELLISATRFAEHYNWDDVVEAEKRAYLKIIENYNT